MLLETVIIEKTALKVARNGPELEAYILEQRKDQYPFLVRSDPLNTFYRQCVEYFVSNPSEETIGNLEFEGVGWNDDDRPDDDFSRPMEDQEVSRTGPNKTTDTGNSQLGNERTEFLQKLLSGKLKEEKERRRMESAPKPPPKPQYIVNIPYGDITPVELDIIKTTAQFAAKNGDNFIKGLLSRDIRTNQYDFLRQGHRHHALFFNLLESYRKCILQVGSVVDTIRATTKTDILQRILKSVEWERYQLQKEKQKTEEEEKDKIVRAMIDWNDFVIVETINFNENDEDLPETSKAIAPPKTDSSSLQTKSNNNNGGGGGAVSVSHDTDMMDVDMDTEDSAKGSTYKPNLDLDLDPDIKIRKDYKPNFLKARNAAIMQKCPICSMDINVEEFEEHIRIELYDPRFAEQKKLLQERIKSTSLAPGKDMISVLSNLAKTRTDIFGNEEDLDIVRKVKDSQPQKEEQRIWDGHSDSIARTSTAAFQAAILHPEEQREERPKGEVLGPQSNPLLPKPNMPPIASPSNPLQPTPNFPLQPTPWQYPGMQMGPSFNPSYPPNPMMGLMSHPSMPPPPPPPADLFQSKRPDLDLFGEPLAKRQKTDDWTSKLVEEDVFLAAAGPGALVSIRVEVPVYTANKEWKLDGQSLELQQSLTCTVALLKQIISERLGIPPNKQKLIVEGLPPLNDKNTFAFYNFQAGTVVQLGVKERGGRKK